jgi:hypothetical protein
VHCNEQKRGFPALEVEHVIPPSTAEPQIKKKRIGIDKSEKKIQKEYECCKLIRYAG